MAGICIFAASSPNIDDKYIAAAESFGRCLAEHGFDLIFGGGRTGLMGACARGVYSKGGRIVGVIPEKLNQPGIPFEHCSEMIVTKDMHERKATMERLSSGFVTLPGGVGTLEELMEVLTFNQLGYIDAPVVIFNQDGFYDNLLAQFDALAKAGFMHTECLKLFSVAATPEEAIEKLIGFRKAKLPDKIKEAVKGHEEHSAG